MTPNERGEATLRDDDVDRALDRQERPDTRRAGHVSQPPSRVPETRATPLQAAFIPLSVVALACGAIAITALELGTPRSATLVRAATLLGTVLLLAVGTDAVVRIWRSAGAWAPIDRGRAAFRLVWIAAIAVGLLVIVLGAIAILAP